MGSRRRRTPLHMHLHLQRCFRHVAHLRKSVYGIFPINQSVTRPSSSPSTRTCHALYILSRSYRQTLHIDTPTICAHTVAEILFQAWSCLLSLPSHLHLFHHLHCHPSRGQALYATLVASLRSANHGSRDWRNLSRPYCPCSLAMAPHTTVAFVTSTK